MDERQARIPSRVELEKKNGKKAMQRELEEKLVEEQRLRRLKAQEMQLKYERERAIQEEYEQRKRELEQERLERLMRVEEERILAEKEELLRLERERRQQYLEVEQSEVLDSTQNYQPPMLFDEDQFGRTEDVNIYQSVERPSQKK